jgi:hypothetical protein
LVYIPSAANHEVARLALAISTRLARRCRQLLSFLSCRPIFVTLVSSRVHGLQARPGVASAAALVFMVSLIFDSVLESLIVCGIVAERSWYYSKVAGSKDSRICDLNHSPAVIFRVRPPSVR